MYDISLSSKKTLKVGFRVFRLKTTMESVFMLAIIIDK